MPDHHAATRISGAITDIFAHRFVVETSSGRILADVGPKGAAKAALRAGEIVDLVGDMKPSELKVSQIIRNGETTTIEHEKTKRPDGQDDEIDPKPAVDAVRATGLTILGKPRRKSKHFEILARDHNGGLKEVHVEHDGAIRRSKSIDSTDHKWAAEIQYGNADG